MIPWRGRVLPPRSRWPSSLRAGSSGAEKRKMGKRNGWGRNERSPASPADQPISGEHSPIGNLIQFKPAAAISMKSCSVYTSAAQTKGFAQEDISTMSHRAPTKQKRKGKKV